MTAYAVALLQSYCLIAGICVAVVGVQRLSAYAAARRRLRPVAMIAPLPVARVAIPAAYRRRSRR